MTDTVFISSSNALGSFWTSKRYFDYLIDETNLPLLRGREFGPAALICPCGKAAVPSEGMRRHSFPMSGS